MYKLESVLENEAPKILRDYDIQTDRRFLAKRQDLVTINKMKKKMPSIGFCSSAGR